MKSYYFLFKETKKKKFIIEYFDTLESAIKKSKEYDSKEIYNEIEIEVDLNDDKTNN